LLLSLRSALEKVLEAVVLLLMSGLAVIVIVGFIARSLGMPLTWSDELAPVLLAWLTYYGAALAALNRAHIGFPRLVAAAPWRLQLGLTLFREAIVIGFFAVAAWAGWRVLLVVDDTYLVSLPWLPLAVTQSVIPIGAVLFIVAELISYADWLSRREPSA